MAESRTARRYYESVTDEYLRYGGLGGWHYGVWDGSVATHGRSLVRATELLFEGIELDESTRVLDVGCGVGDLASWVSTRHGCQVLGLTIVPEHIELARERCSELDGRVRFALGDMNDLDLEPESFDVIVNQETLCYAIDPCDYLTTARRALAPGGWWRAIEFSRCETLRDQDDIDEYRRTLAGFEIPALHAQDEIGRALEMSGFVDRGVADLTPLVSRTAEMIVQEARKFESLAAVGGQWMVPGQVESPAQIYGHFDAGRAYSEGLLSGWARHLYFQGRRPLPA